jgi:threonine synthase
VPGLPVIVAMPDDTPKPFFDECALYGATIHRVQGTIADAGKYLREHGPKDAYDVSTLREPYRIEGKKTMAYELVEQLDGECPTSCCIRPAAAPAWSACGRRSTRWRPSAGFRGNGGRASFRCRRWAARRSRRLSTRAPSAPSPWANAQTRAYGLRVPSPLGGFICLRALRETHGTAIAIDEAEMQRATLDLAAQSGIDVCPEGGAAWAALAQLRREWLRSADRSRDRASTPAPGSNTANPAQQPVQIQAADLAARPRGRA